MTKLLMSMGIVNELVEAFAPEIDTLSLIGSGEVGEELSYSVLYTVTPYPAVNEEPQWLRDGVPIDGEIGPTYTPTTDDEGASITLHLFSWNIRGNDTVETTGKIIVFPPPEFTSLPSISPSSGNTGSTFTVSYTISGLGVTEERQWLVDGVEVSGATGPTYQARPEDGDADLTCRVRATNSGGQVENVSDPAASITYTEAPVLSGWSLSPLSGLEAGDPITAQGSVSGVPAPELTYQWTNNNVNISGATLATLASAPQGTIRCVVTATNAYGNHQITVGPVTVSAITPGGPTIDLSSVDPVSYSQNSGVQTLDLAALSTGDNLVHSAIKKNGLTALAALVVQEGVGGTRNGATAFPYAASPAGFSYALTGPSATFTVGSDPRGGITNADLPTGVSINTTTGVVTVSAAAADMAATSFTVWLYNQAVFASQTLSITITATPDNIWDVVFGAEKITINDMPPAPTEPQVTFGVEKITITG